VHRITPNTVPPKVLIIIIKKKELWKELRIKGAISPAAFWRNHQNPMHLHLFLTMITIGKLTANAASSASLIQ
jgi:hypothetical protein